VKNMHFKIFKMIATRGVHQIRFRPGLCPGRWGSSRRSPDPLVGWGGGHPLPIPTPLDAFGVSVSSPAATRPRRLRRLVPKTPSEFFSGYGPARDTLGRPHLCHRASAGVSIHSAILFIISVSPSVCLSVTLCYCI